jgi:hypothetical protein
MTLSFRHFTRVMLISLFAFPWWTGASEPGNNAEETAAGPDWAQGESVRAHFESSQHFAAVRAATTDEIVAAIIFANTHNRPTAIHVEPGTYNFNQAFGSNFGDSVLPPIITTVLIDGHNAVTTIFDGQQGASVSGRALTVLAGGNLLIRNLTLKNFLVQCFIDCTTNGGGGLENAGGDVRIEDCTISGNFVLEQNGDNTLGGGIFNQSGRMEIERTTVTQNLSIGVGGGGIAVTGGSVLIRHSVLSENNAIRGGPHSASFGGGLYVAAAKAWVSGSTITGNTTSTCCDDEIIGSGSGIYNDGGEVWVTDSAIIQNMGFASGFGGGISNNGRMRVANTTIAANSTASGGGGIFNFSDLTLQGVTITNNISLNLRFHGLECALPEGADLPECDIGGGGVGTDKAATTHMADSVIAGNVSGGNCYGEIVSAGHNAIGSDSSCTLDPAHGAAHDLPSVNPRLGPLSDNGQPGNAHYPLLPNSPLIDAAGEPGRFCSNRDQIGNPRVNAEDRHHHSPLCDIGAIEFQP